MANDDSSHVLDEREYQPVTLNLDRAAIRQLDEEADRLSTRLARPSRSAVARDLLARVRASNPR